MEGPYADEGSVEGNHLRASFRGHKRLEMEYIKEQKCMQKGYQTRHDSDERFSQGERTMNYIPEGSHCSDQKRELENLQKQVKDLEIELRGQRRKRD